MDIKTISKLFSEGTDYLGFYDSVYYVSSSDLISSIEDQALLTRLHNSILKAVFTLDEDTPLGQAIKSASYFIKEAETMVEGGNSLSSWKNMSIDEVRKSILDAILAYEKYVVYMGVYNLLGFTEDDKVQNISADFLREKFPDATEQEIEMTADVYLEYIEELEDMGLADEVMNIDFYTSGKEVLSFEDDDEDNDDEDDIVEEDYKKLDNLTWDM